MLHSIKTNHYFCYMRYVALTLLYWMMIYSARAQSYIRFENENNLRWADSVLNTLTLEEKVGQLLMPRGNMSGKPHDVEKLKMWVRDYTKDGVVA